MNRENFCILLLNTYIHTFQLQLHSRRFDWCVLLADLPLCETERAWKYSLVLTVPTRAVLLCVLCKAMILMVYSVAGLRPEG